MDKLELFAALKTPVGKYTPHPKQVEFHRAVDLYRNVYWLAGRQTGKTLAAAVETVFAILTPHSDGKPQTIGLVSDKLKFAEAIFEKVQDIVHANPSLRKMLTRENRSQYKMLMEFSNGASLHARSSHTPTTLAGDTYSLLITDESGFVTNKAMSILRPTVAVRKGRHIAIGTADVTETWFKDAWLDNEAEYEVFKAGKKPTSRSISLHASSTDNPYFGEEELALIAKSETARNLRLLYYAEFSDDDNRVISSEDVENAMVLDPPSINAQGKQSLPKPEALEGRRYVAGVDIGRHVDFTVVTILDVTEPIAKLVRIDRFQGRQPNTTATQVATILSAYNATAYVDATGAGDVYVNLIQKLWRNTKPYHFNLTTKAPLIENLVLKLEQGELLLFPHREMEDEFDRYKMYKSASGHIQYRAESGHDDIVTSLALACNGIRSVLDARRPRIRTVITREKHV